MSRLKAFSDAYDIMLDMQFAKVSIVYFVMNAKARILLTIEGLSVKVGRIGCK